MGTDYEMAGHMQGEMIGNYLLENYDKYDLNKDGKISYVMFKGQEGNLEAIARTQYAVEDCNVICKKRENPQLNFMTPATQTNILLTKTVTGLPRRQPTI